MDTEAMRRRVAIIRHINLSFANIDTMFRG